ncbi:ribosome recycling factor [bacterium]|nr:ribosome recycling factor [bacterium]
MQRSSQQKIEEAKQAIRNIRQDAIKDIDKAFNDKSIGEDEKFTQKEEIDKACKEVVSEIEKLGESKKKDLMTV